MEDDHRHVPIPAAPELGLPEDWAVCDICHMYWPVLNWALADIAWQKRHYGEIVTGRLAQAANQAKP